MGIWIRGSALRWIPHRLDECRRLFLGLDVPGNSQWSSANAGFPCSSCSIIGFSLPFGFSAIC